MTSFREYLDENKDELDALQFFYSQPYQKRLRFQDIKELSDAIGAPPRSWTPERLWKAHEILERDKVRGVSGKRLLSDIVSLVRFALHQEDELIPFAAQVKRRFSDWMLQQAVLGRAFTEQQVEWLTMMRAHIATSLEIEVDDFSLTPFVEEGGLGKAAQVFGNELGNIIKELNEVLAA